jgi:thiamine biosynthesis lipoprotein
LKLVDETPGAAALFLRLTPDGVKTYESSRFQDVPKVRSPEAEKRAG